MEKLVEILGIPGTSATLLVVGYILLQIIGELLELKGKIVPEFFKIRKYFKRKKEEKEAAQRLLNEVRATMEELNRHYSEDNITQRDNWIEQINEKTRLYDESVKQLVAMQGTLEASNEMTLDLYINVNRNRIIDFASKVANCKDTDISREEFNRIFKVYENYEETIERYNKTNGEVDIAYRVIQEAYQERLRARTFLEDKRGY